MCVMNKLENMGKLKKKKFERNYFSFNSGLGIHNVFSRSSKRYALYKFTQTDSK